MKTYTCPGFYPVQAHTKSEARKKFKAQLLDDEKLTFRPQKITRLPVGSKVEREFVPTGYCEVPLPR